MTYKELKKRSEDLREKKQTPYDLIVDYINLMTDAIVTVFECENKFKHYEQTIKEKEYEIDCLKKELNVTRSIFKYKV